MIYTGELNKKREEHSYYWYRQFYKCCWFYECPIWL